MSRIYSEFPATVCENCARCCFESPGVFYVEYLSMLEALAEMSAQRRQEFLTRAFRELFFSWIEPERTCIFLESGRCAIYDRRPLACRLFGLVPAGDRAQAEAEARLAARQEARRLRHFGIEIPEEVVQRSLVSCDRVRDKKGRVVEVDGESLAARVAKLDAALLPTEVIIEEFCFRSLPERLGASALGGGTLEGLRVQLLRRAQAGESAQELVTRVLAQAKLPALFRKKPRG
ncbi:MAG: YkgJ family cysteine cluster protein [Armatimonadetes bacterium]|nr:YkgJ family cysteine cluster protein [Armatimonadota bacterium]